MRGVEGTKYISKTKCRGHTYYSIERTINGKSRFFGSGKTLIEALMKRDWVESNNWTTKYPTQFKCDEKYINRRNSGTYVVEKTINGKHRYYGGFNNLEDAVKFRDYCIKNGWSSNCVYQNPMKNIQKRHGNYQVKVYLNGKNQYVGTFKSLENAMEVRDLFIKYNGDWDLICEGFEFDEECWMEGKLAHNNFFEKHENIGPKDLFIAKHEGLLFRGAEE